MTTTNKLSFLLFAVAVFSATIHEVNSQGAVLYPFGPGAGDLALPSNDDGSAGPINLETGAFPFFGSNHNTLFVNNNGDLTFDSPLSSFTPQSFPITNGVELIAPFWADVDTRGTGNVFYRETRDPALLQRAQSDIRMAFPALTVFNPAFLFIATWDRVGYFSSNTDLLNTFQCILVTDTRHSFVIFLYPENGINWVTGDASGGDGGFGGTPAQVGFNAGDGLRYFSVPGSQTAAIVDVESTSNVARPGVWIFRVDEEEIVNSECSTLVDAPFQVLPRFGTMLGGTPVLVAGPCFEPGDVIDCIFDGRLTSGFFVSEIRALCVTPPFPDSGQRDLEIRVSNQTSLKFSGITRFFSVYVEESSDVMPVIEDLLITPGDTLTLQWSPADVLPNVDPTNYTVDINVVTNVLGGQRMETLKENVMNNGSCEITLPTLATTPTDDVSTIAFYVTVSSDSESVLFDRLSGIVRRWTTILYHSASRFLRERCDRWIQSQPPNIGDTILNNVLPCPPTVDRARRDNSFREDTGIAAVLSRLFHPGTDTCFRQVRLTSVSGSQCCYNIFGELVVGPPGGGTVDRFAPVGFFGILRHFQDDVLPSIYCCLGAFSNCGAYYMRRPSDNGSRYNPPPPAFMNGDPHLVSLDGYQYTFNGHGEFVLVESIGLFEMQGRMVQASDPTGALTNGTVFTALVARAVDSDTVQFQVGGITGFPVLEVLVNGELIFLDASSALEFNNVTISERGNALEALFANGAIMEARLVNGFISAVIVSLPTGFMGQTRGLLGNYNGDESDDLIPRRLSDSLPDNSSLRIIHEEFGITWIIDNEQDSLFSYAENEGWATFYQPNFEPVFEPEFSDPALQAQAEALCGDDFFCLFDVAVTNDLTIGNATLTGNQALSEIMESFQLVVCTPPCENGACVDNNTCSCSVGFSGDRCDTPNITACDQNPCQNGGTCSVLAGSITCECSPEFTGLDCSTVLFSNVTLGIENRRYSTLEGEEVEVCVNVLTGVVVTDAVVAYLHIEEYDIWLNLTIEVGMDRGCVGLVPPDDNILNEVAQWRTMITISFNDSRVTIAEEASHARLIISDDEIIEIGFQQNEYLFAEGQISTQVCVQLLSDIILERPILARVYSVSPSNSATEDVDHRAVLQIVSIDVESEQADVFCVAVSINDDGVFEQGEYFTVVLETFDVHAMVVEELSEALVIIQDNDLVNDLVISFTDDTPMVMGGTARISFTSNMPLDSATCMISRRRAFNCIGGVFEFRNLLSSSAYRITIVATSGNFTSVVTRRIRSETSGQCSVVHINEVERIGGDVQIKFALLGPSAANRVTDAMCQVDGGQRFPCQSPLVRSDAPGNHRLVVLPVDPDGRCGRRQGLILNYSLP